MASSTTNHARTYRYCCCCYCSLQFLSNYTQLLKWYLIKHFCSLHRVHLFICVHSAGFILYSPFVSSNHKKLFEVANTYFLFKRTNKWIPQFHINFGWRGSRCTALSAGMRIFQNLIWAKQQRGNMISNF